MKNQQKHNPNKLILVDADGVCLDWEYAFTIWMEEHGFTKVENAPFIYDIGERYNIDKTQAKKLIRMFNESAAIGFLPPHRDAMYYIKRLHEEHGYVFHCITSLSKDINAQRLREMNLNKLFGKTAFERIVCLDTGADKNHALEIAEQRSHRGNQTSQENHGDIGRDTSSQPHQTAHQQSYRPYYRQQ